MNKKLLKTLMVLAIILTPTLATAKNTEGITSQDIIDAITAIVALGLFLAMLVHMLYVKFKLTPRYKTTFSVEEFKQIRIAKGAESESTEIENQTMLESLTSIVANWKEIVNEETGESSFRPTRFKHLKTAFKQVNQVIDQAPTDQTVVDELNDYINVITINEERHFDGSKIIMWITGGFALLLLFFGVWQLTLSMVIGLAMYYLSSLRPTFLLAKAREGKVGFINKLLIGVLVMIGAANTVKKTTVYGDGHKDVEYDNSQHWIAWVIGIIVIVIIAFYLPIWSAFNYLRNYIIYW